MPIAFTESQTNDSNRGGIELASGWVLMTGTLTFSGSYTLGGDVVDFGAKSGISGIMREVIILNDLRGANAEYVVATKKIKLWKAMVGEVPTEKTAAAYDTAFTASPVPVAAYVRLG